jgi:hypothetical protein
VAIPGLRELDAEEINLVVGHPAQYKSVVAVAALIAAMRGCGSAADYDEIQRELFRHVWETETRRGQISRCLKRVRRGESLPTDAPELGNGLPADEEESWRYENFTYERLGRQLRCVGDALAWRATGYNRAYIIAASANASAGPITNKEGLESELGVVEERFRDHGRFVLLHDLTNCLRIGDATEFMENGARRVIEVKKSGRRHPQQTQRMKQLVDAMMSGSALPGLPGSGIVRLATPMRTHLATLADAVRLADQRGIAGLVVPRGQRFVICASLPVISRDGEPEGWVQRSKSELTRLQRRLGLREGTDDLTINSGDTAARAAGLAPFAIYPLSALHCAQLICDQLTIDVHMPASAVIRAMEDRGLSAQFPLGGSNSTVTPRDASFHVHDGQHTITLHASAIAQQLLEFVTLDTLADSICEVLSLPSPPAQPIPVYTDEPLVWGK